MVARTVPRRCRRLDERRTIGANGGLLEPMGRHRTPASDSGRRHGTLEVPDLAKTADDARGMSNLATMPRAGNISTDTRAGVLGWSRARS